MRERGYDKEYVYMCVCVCVYERKRERGLGVTQRDTKVKGNKLERERG